MKTDFNEYVTQLQLEILFKQLGSPDPTTLAETTKHFTIKEGEKRDQIVIDYFGRKGINRIVNIIARILLEPPELPSNANILDVGAGSGFLTVRIAKKIKESLPGVSFYAMDLTPAMLLSFAKKKADITLFVGIAESIKGSMKEARRFFDIPYRLDAIFSTLMLHHNAQPARVFESFRRVLKKNGRAVVVDLCKHGFEEFRTEMGDVHLGFKPSEICKMGQENFEEVRVERLEGIRCESSGGSAEIFVAVMKKPMQKPG